MVEFKYVFLAGAGIHQIFKRREPSVLQFLGLVSLLNVGLFAESYYDPSFPSSTLFMHVVRTSKYAILTTSTFLLGVASATIAYRLSPLHPLASYPGPILPKVTKWWMAYWIGKGERHLVLQRLHEKYGPWIRIGPNELSVNLPSAVRPVYSQMFRAPAYQGAPQDADALITTTSREEHASRLIAWNKAFAPESLRNFRSITQTRTEQLLEILQRERTSSESNGKSSVDLSHWVSLWSMDIMGDMSFSGGFETMAAGKDTEGWMEVLQMGVLFVGILGQVPWLRDIIALLPQPGPIITFQQFAGRKVRETKALAGGAAKHDILGIIQDPSSGGPVLSTAQAAADASFIVVAGSDTVSQGSTALLRLVIGDKDVQRKIRDELEREFSGEELDAARLARLEYLDACVQEGLRMIPPVAAGPPRYADRPMQVLGRHIPQGTTVACPIWTMQRDPKNFSHPDQFQPERWVSSENTQKATSVHSPEAFVPFCYGPGVCIGKPVALHNMKYLIAKLLTSFELDFADGFDVKKFDRSWKEHNLWLHDPLLVKVKPL